LKLQTTNGAVAEHAHDDAAARSLEHADLRRKTTRGALVSSVSQAATLFFRVGSMVVMARLLLPGDFGLVGMVTAFTGFLGLFRDAGLSMAMVQRESITEAQVSTLFWINAAVGGLLAILSTLLAPILVRFYGEPRLFLITVALGMAFLFNGVAAQHRAMLQRSMRFATLAVVDIVSLLFCIAAAVATALAGGGYWALVVMTVALPALSALGVWIAGRWIPRRPQRDSGVRSMLVYGGTLTLNSVIGYLAYNADKVLIGKFCGADTLGIYGRAYQLINLPTENLNTAIGSVAFPALSRVQNDPVRLKSYFLKGYSLFLSLVMPITMACALFADNIIHVMLGTKWHEAAGIFRLLAPTIVAFALINPFGWLLLATGQAARSLKISLSIAPIIVISYAIGLRQGPHGVAAGFSIAMVALTIPVVWWAKQGTLIAIRDVLGIAAKPLLSVLAGAVAVWAVGNLTGRVEPTLLRLVLECSVLFGVYLVVLLFVFNEAKVYMDLLRTAGLWPRGTQRN
jgi:O-antigen/teichoic acid export membrane protein